ncbi:unnamed protein product [Durusdinium trenchii]|uniref:Alpha-amylase n=1 Tax=Durusdinium trenchii TaxID=1381693 RepID=A0ABP0MI02_9DINO
MLHCFSGLLRWLLKRCRRRTVKAAMASVNGKQYRVVRNFNGKITLRTGLDYDLANDDDDDQPTRLSCWGFAGKDYARMSETTEETASPDLSEDGMMSEDLSKAEGPPQPRTIFHALHQTFDDLRRILPELSWKGFDAIQIPPAHVSRQGDLRRDWYLRYQPLSYEHVDLALGGAESLQRLCEEAHGYGIMVIADCVFNHMAVVASYQEWQEAQHDGHKMEELKQRLDHSFGPHFDRHDFQFPWIPLEGEKWDDPNYTFEGWGCGEWSELRWSDKVVSRHLQHLRMLLDCGVTGFRIDAAKHMRPQHVAKYVDFVQGEGAFIYTEVLSMDRNVHSQYERLGFGLPSTDFLLAASLAKTWRESDAGHLSAELQAAEHLGSHSVQFVRNHDTMLNDGPAICGIDWSSAEEASLAWAYLIAKNEGSVLLHQDDIHTPVVQAALAFRSALSSVLASAVPYSIKAELVAWPPPNYKTIAMMLTLAECPVGLAVFNITSQKQNMEIPWQLENYSLQEVKANSRDEHLQAGCSPKHLDKHLQPRMARFFLLECFTGPLIQPNPQLRYMTLFYYCGWECPHIHFCVEHVWTNVPGWVLRKCDKPAVQGFKLPKSSHHGRWWRVDIPLRKRCSVEFVLNDGGHSWDNHPSALGNYIAEMPGLHILVNKKLASLCL